MGAAESACAETPCGPVQSCGPGCGGILEDQNVRFIDVEKTSQITSLVFIERLPKQKASAADADAASTKVSSSLASSRPSTICSSRQASYQTLSIVQASGIGGSSMPPEKLDPEKVALFKAQLMEAGIDATAWGVGGAKSVEHLYWEAYVQRGCIIVSSYQRTPPELKRITRLVKVRLSAEIFGEHHVLTSRMQFMHDGQIVERNQLPLRKLVWKVTDDVKEEICAPADCPYTEDWRAACTRTLTERLGLSAEWQRKHLEEDESQYHFNSEDNVMSSGYPGLNTLYCIHEVTMRIKDPQHSEVLALGLPSGQEFATAEGDFNFYMVQDDAGMPIGSQLNIWKWVNVETFDVIPLSEKESPVLMFSPTSSGAEDRMKVELSEKEMPPVIPPERVPPPPDRIAFGGMEGMHEQRPGGKPPFAPSTALRMALEGEKTDWSRVKRMAANIMKPNYHLDHFLADLEVAFPETHLHLLEASSPCSSISWGLDTMAPTASRSVSQCDEYQRTIGAFFSIYWLVRMEVDGKDGFSFGVNTKGGKAAWRPLKAENDGCYSAPDRRINFRENADWDHLKRLLFQAGIFTRAVSCVPGKKSTLAVNSKRLTSLLALTSLHDIMKGMCLLPEVQPEHAPYRGYAAGDMILDHDTALAYVLEHFPGLLPSFKGLDAQEQRLLLFTQCKLGFNHGWFVQAEAPPGAGLTSFKQALADGTSGCAASPQDVAFYFVHWLTDLAGAEPTPLNGCEKFSTKFPLQVLNSFLRSFEFVEKVANETETEVMEQYLKMRWSEQSAQLSLGPVPTGDDAITKMRLLCMAQMKASSVLAAWESLDEDDKQVLSVEMSLTGCAGQSFSPDLVPKVVIDQLEGPAFLVYYGPAFLQNTSEDEARWKLSALAEVYRCARALWPLSPAEASSSVIIRIDMIKTRTVAQLQQVSEIWTLVKHNNQEAFVELSSQKKLNAMIANQQCIQVLDFTSFTRVRAIS